MTDQPAKRRLPSTITLALVDIVGYEHVITAVPAIIGRADADIVVEHASVSNRHALVEVEGNQVFLRDLRSRNGVRLNGFPVSDRVAIAHGDEIAIGSVNFQVKLVVPKAKPTGPKSDPNAMTAASRQAPKVLPIGQGRTVVLLVSISGRQQQYVLENRITTIGRQGCDITIEDAELSRKHMQIEVYSDHFGLKDLASSNGTFVNDKPISYLKVPGQVTFKAGSTTFELFFGDQVGM